MKNFLRSSYLNVTRFIYNKFIIAYEFIVITMLLFMTKAVTHLISIKKSNVYSAVPSKQQLEQLFYSPGAKRGYKSFYANYNPLWVSKSFKDVNEHPNYNNYLKNKENISNTSLTLDNVISDCDTSTEIPSEHLEIISKLNEAIVSNGANNEM